MHAHHKIDTYSIICNLQTSHNTAANHFCNSFRTFCAVLLGVQELQVEQEHLLLVKCGRVCTIRKPLLAISTGISLIEWHRQTCPSIHRQCTIRFTSGSKLPNIFVVRYQPFREHFFILLHLQKRNVNLSVFFNLSNQKWLYGYFIFKFFVQY